MRRKPSASLRASGLVDTRDASLWLSLSLINTAVVVNALNRMLVLGLARSPSSGTFLAQTNIRVTDAKWRARDLSRLDADRGVKCQRQFDKYYSPTIMWGSGGTRR